MLTSASHYGLEHLAMRFCLQVKAHHLLCSHPSPLFSYTGFLWFLDAEDIAVLVLALSVVLCASRLRRHLRAALCEVMSTDSDPEACFEPSALPL